jgi:hypothetical protein
MNWFEVLREGFGIYNVVLVAVLDFFNEGPLLEASSVVLVLSCLAVVLGTCVAVVGQLFQVEKSKKSILEFDALAIIGIVVGTLYLTFRFQMA